MGEERNAGRESRPNSVRVDGAKVCIAHAKPLEGGAYGVCQNAQCEVRLSQTAYSLSTNSNASGRNSPLVFVYDARGNGGGGVCPTITGDHQDRITDYTAIVLATPHPPTVDMPPDLERSEQAAGT